jgi:lysyl-tRNA synthetase class 2
MLEKVQADRLAKLEKIRQLGIDPYGGRYDSAQPIAEVLARFVDGAEGQSADIAGRLVLLRDMGKMMFCHLRDSTGQMQICLRKDTPGKPPKGLEETSWALAKLLDLGDWVAVSGPLAKTRTGEVTVWADRLTLLCKSLNPMPEKFHGLQDVETRYRRRYLDLMTNPDSMAVFKKRIAIIETFRSLLKKRGFVEVETPILQPIYGGGAAKPFTTHHNTLDAELFLRISPELYLKRLLVGGMEKVFEIGRNFRNEGIDARHNPEFTMMELYQAGADYEVMMEISEELIATSAREVVAKTKPGINYLREVFQAWRHGQNLLHLAKDSPGANEIPEDLNAEITNINRYMDEMFARAVQYNPTDLGIQKGKIVLPYGDMLIDFTPPWPRRKYADLLKEHAGVEMGDPAAVRAKARQLGIEEGNKDDAVVVNEVFAAAVEPALAGANTPVFVIDYPADICPLTRRKADEASIALRFELYIAGMEIANAYTELNDPAVQEANFGRQLRGEGDAAAMRMMDEDFVEALRHGMPPAGGLGIGIDRVVMLLTNSASIRDVVLFPLLRPEAK